VDANYFISWLCYNLVGEMKVNKWCAIVVMEVSSNIDSVMFLMI